MRSGSTSTFARTSSSGSARRKVFDAFTFAFEKTEHGWIWAHAYRFAPDCSTFIVECSEETWRDFGFDRMDQAEAIAACEKLFAKYLDGHALHVERRASRGSAAWLNFRRIKCERWSTGNVILLGDAAHTAHFSVGSGTKLALEDAIKLADVLNRPGLSARSRDGRICRRAEPRSPQAAEQRAQLDRMVRDARTLHAFRAAAVRLFAADAQPADQPREPAPARPRMAGRCRALVLEARDGRPLEQDRAADVRAVQAARDGGREPHHRLADGDVFGGRRHAERLPLRPLRRARDGRRGPRLHRDDLRLARRPDQPGLHRHVERRACRRVEADRRFRPRQFEGEDLPPARPFAAPRVRPASAGKRTMRRCPTATGR